MSLHDHIHYLISNQYCPSENFTSEALEQLDYKIHDYYQEFTDSHPKLPAEEIVEELAYNLHIKVQPLRLEDKRKLLDEFMSTNLGKLYVSMVNERRDLQKNGRMNSNSAELI